MDLGIRVLGELFLILEKKLGILAVSLSSSLALWLAGSLALKGWRFWLEGGRER